MSIQFFRFAKNLPTLVICAVGLCLTGAFAQTAANVSDVNALYTAAQRWVDASLIQQGSALPVRMEVVVGQLDSRLKLAPCLQVEPYLPAGSQLWGNTRLGLRCMQGSSKWNVFLPITVKAFGPAWVIKGSVAAGTSLTTQDAMAVEVDWAESNSPIVASQNNWLGKTATRQLSTGQPIRQDMVKAAQVFQAGTQVRVLATGAGFEIASHGLAISAGVIGQSARVRLDNGQVLNGTVQDERTVRIVL